MKPSFSQNQKACPKLTCGGRSAVAALGFDWVAVVMRLTVLI
jgi:hypothetical protein